MISHHLVREAANFRRRLAGRPELAGDDSLPLAETHDALGLLAGIAEGGHVRDFVARKEPDSPLLARGERRNHGDTETRRRA